MLLACRLPAASSAAGARAFLRTWLITPGLPSAAPRSAAPRWASPPRCSRRNMSFMSTTHFFLPLRGAGRLAPHGAGDPFDCGRRARKSRWKATPATNRRGSSCWSRKSRRCGLGTRSGSVRSPLRRLPAPPSPSPTLPSPSPHRHRRPRQPCHRYRRHRRIPVRRRRRPRCHRHRPRRHGLRHPLPPPWPPPSPPSPSPSPLPPLPSPLSPPLPPSPPSPLSRDAAPLLSLIRSRLIETVRSVCGTSWFSRRFCESAAKTTIFSRGAAAPHPTVGQLSAFSLYQLFPLHILGARLPMPRHKHLTCPRSFHYRF